jgi:hypothetical protein
LAEFCFALTPSAPFFGSKSDTLKPRHVVDAHANIQKLEEEEMRLTRVSVLAVFGLTAVVVSANAADNQGLVDFFGSLRNIQPVDLRGSPTNIQECGPAESRGFIEIDPFGDSGNLNVPNFRYAANQDFVLTDIEWTVTSADDTQPQELSIANLFTFSSTQRPVLIVPASTINGSIAYGQVHLVTGRVIHGGGIDGMQGICAGVSSGTLQSIEIQGFLRPTQSTTNP